MMVYWLTGFVCAALAGSVTEQWVPVTGAQWAAFVWLGLGVNALAYLLWALALKNTKNMAAVAILAYLVPLLSVVVSAVFLHETISARALAAMVLIIGGIAIQNIAEST